MRKLCVVFCVMLVFVLGGTALAGEMKPSVSLGGQLAMPMGDFGDAWKMGFGGNGRFGLQFGPKFEAGLTLGYNSVPLDEDGVLDVFLGDFRELLGMAGVTVSASGADMTMLEVLADFKFFIPAGAEGSAFKPYLTGTAGMVSVSIDDLDFTLEAPGLPDITETIPSGSESAAVFGIGAGFEYMFSPKVGFWLDGKYMLSSLKIQMMTLTLSGYGVTEMDVAYLPIRAGVKIMFGGTE